MAKTWRCSAAHRGEIGEWGGDDLYLLLPVQQLRDWADVLLIAPLDANTLAKMANGLCDNLLVLSIADGQFNLISRLVLHDAGLPLSP